MDKNSKDILETLTFIKDRMVTKGKRRSQATTVAFWRGA
jgi:hypothetical protein